MTKKILIKGAGEQASAVAHRLFQCGYQVVMTEIDKPTAVRRRVSFSTAIYEKEIEIEGVAGRFWVDESMGRRVEGKEKQILVFVDPACQIKNIYKPDIIIDGRILKKNLDNKITDAELTIALGPGIDAGKDVHYVVETNRGHDLGRIISKGFAASDTKVPGNIAGFTTERVLRSSQKGLFQTDRNIGDKIEKGEIVARVNDQEIKTEISGVIRGLLPTGLEVEANQKLGDIDPRGNVSYCNTISDKARCISGSVLEIVMKTDVLSSSV
ncbi:MAG: selenium-dependent molybdenum cofactor biosynthesis protein YqeB [bacterium]|nr:EF2563 family selenium-dependent molybdenum hydroxylase system protein [bacterium]MBU1918809.1 EF2563 family selenium-dependent molybdenum hydroxylase system protein [bacterium]